MIRRRRLVVFAVLVSIVQVGFLAWTIAGRAGILREGREVLLKVEPVDPRDLLRGDYVRLGYEISLVPVSILVNRPKAGAEIEPGPIFVRVKKTESGYWHVVSASLGKAPDNPIAADEVEIRGRVERSWPLDETPEVPVDYGIERFYLPEGQGLSIEQDMRVRPFAIKAAIASDGRAQIKALMDGPKLLFEEPLY